jgi:hypothetical protein
VREQTPRNAKRPAEGSFAVQLGIGKQPPGSTDPALYRSALQRPRIRGDLVPARESTFVEHRLLGRLASAAGRAIGSLNPMASRAGSRCRLPLFVGLALGGLGSSLALAASAPTFKLVDTHKTPPVSALGKRPTTCTASSQAPCVESGSYGSVRFSPHILTNGGVLTATVTPSRFCHACAATWPATGLHVSDAVFRYLKVMRGCGPLKCRWRVDKNAPFVAYAVIALNISPHPPVNGPSVVSDYAGIRSPFAYKYVP